MKKVLLAFALLASVSFAAENSSGDQGLYVGAGVGIMATNKDGNTGIGLGLRGGVELDDTLNGLGIQVELNRSFSDPENAANRNIDVTTMAAYTTFEINIPDSKASLRPKIGLILPNMRDDIDSRDLILSSGFGMTYKIERNVRLFLDYTVLGEAISNYSAGVEIKF